MPYANFRESRGIEVDLSTFQTCGTVRISRADEQIGTGFLVRENGSTIYFVTAAHVMSAFPVELSESDSLDLTRLSLNFIGIDGAEIELCFDTQKFNEVETDAQWQYGPSPIPDIAVIKIAQTTGKDIVPAGIALKIEFSSLEPSNWLIFVREDLVAVDDATKGAVCYANGYPNPPILPNHSFEKPHFREGELVELREATSTFGRVTQFVLSSLTISGGDSGGPLVIQGQNGKAQVIGILTNRPHEDLEHTLAWPTSEIVFY